MNRHAHFQPETACSPVPDPVRLGEGARLVVDVCSIRRERTCACCHPMFYYDVVIGLGARGFNSNLRIRPQTPNIGRGCERNDIVCFGIAIHVANWKRACSLQGIAKAQRTHEPMGGRDSVVRDRIHSDRRLAGPDIDRLAQDARFRRRLRSAAVSGADEPEHRTADRSEPHHRVQVRPRRHRRHGNGNRGCRDAGIGPVRGSGSGCEPYRGHESAIRVRVDQRRTRFRWIHWRRGRGACRAPTGRREPERHGHGGGPWSHQCTDRPDRDVGELPQGRQRKRNAFSGRQGGRQHDARQGDCPARDEQCTQGRGAVPAAGDLRRDAQPDRSACDAGLCGMAGSAVRRAQCVTSRHGPGRREAGQLAVGGNDAQHLEAVLRRRGPVAATRVFRAVPDLRGLAEQQHRW